MSRVVEVGCGGKHGRALDGKVRGAVLVAALVAALAACSQPAGNNVETRDAGNWLYKACGVRLSQAPVLVANNAGGRRRAPESASGSVAVPAADLPAVLEALRLNRTLHLRGQSESRYSYESASDVLPEKSCELDARMHVLYFRYRE